MVEHQAAFEGFAEAGAGMVGVKDAEEAGQAGGHGLGKCSRVLGCFVHGAEETRGFGDAGQGELEEAVRGFHSDEGRGEVVVGILSLLETGEQHPGQWGAEFTCQGGAAGEGIGGAGEGRVVLVGPKAAQDGVVQRFARFGTEGVKVVCGRLNEVLKEGALGEVVRGGEDGVEAAKVVHCRAGAKLGAGGVCGPLGQAVVDGVHDAFHLPCRGWIPGGLA
ncbi:hypothetical protein [Streptomyces sp. NPDC102476]|uniref:hypothetical protein n=1 Tax=Streptomyces sp. NPDC102476 TaxID=3366181 RepID=UPI0037F62EC9